MRRSLNADILYYMFEAASMSRWNDHLRTLDLTELDKQAHKAVIAWTIGRSEEDSGTKVDWDSIMENCLFGFLQRIALTDLKPQIYHKIADEKRKEVAEYVLDTFDKKVPDANGAFREKFRDYLYSEHTDRENGIIDAAHYLATKWEFDTIYEVNRSVYGIEKTRRSIYSQVGQFGYLAGVSDIVDSSSGLYRFINTVGQLRFQQRWSRTPRVPKTTVLGHSVLVAFSVLLNDMDSGISGRRRYFDFFSALFHDLPEVLTKDVITPVKNSVDGLRELLEETEHELVEAEIMPLIPAGWRTELGFMAYDPFTDSDEPPRNGRQIKACDMMGAWMEAHLSIRYGISNKTLRDGVAGAERRFRDEPDLERSIGAGEIMERFRSMDI